MTTFFFNSAKCANFEVSSLGLELQVSSLGLEVFVEVSVSSRNFNQVSVSTTSLENFYTFFIKKLFAFFLTLCIGKHKDHQAQLAAFNHLDA